MAGLRSRAPGITTRLISSRSLAQLPADAPRILCFGDSLTEGFAKRGSVMAPYANALARALGSRAIVHEAGVSGETTAQMGPRLGGILAHAAQTQQPYHLTLLLGGTNDCCMGKQAADVVTRLRGLHAAVLASHPTARSVVLTVPEIDTPRPGTAEAMQGSRQLDRDLAFVNAALRLMPSEPAFARTAVFDLHERLPQHVPGPSAPEPEAGLWDADFVHLSARGYEWLGEQLATFIDENQLLLPPTATAQDLQ